MVEKQIGWSWQLDQGVQRLKVDCGPGTKASVTGTTSDEIYVRTTGETGDPTAEALLKTDDGGKGPTAFYSDPTTHKYIYLHRKFAAIRDFESEFLPSFVF